MIEKNTKAKGESVLTIKPRYTYLDLSANCPAPVHQGEAEKGMLYKKTDLFPSGFDQFYNRKHLNCRNLA